ncbi:hypothetical protein KI387_015949, partial [Taxus chinensis]
MAAFRSAAAFSCVQSGGIVKFAADAPNLGPLRRQRTVVLSSGSLNFGSISNNKVKIKATAELVEQKGGTEQVLARPRKAAVAEAHNNGNKGGAHSRTFLTEEELFLGIRKKIEAKRLPANAADAMEGVYRNYKNA